MIDLDMPYDATMRIIYDEAWKAVLEDSELRFARQRLSIHELRHIIRAAVGAALTWQEKNQS